jgi:LysR family transcriptional regulator, nitrogen assimilation regulatory protein
MIERMAALESLISLRQMRYFVCVLEQKGFTSAAAILHVAQPSLSRQIAQMEEALEAQLLIRTPSGIIPTEAGLKVYQTSRDLLDVVNSLSDAIHGSRQEPEGRVAIALPATSGTEFIADLIKTCKAEIPKVELHVQDTLSALTSQALSSGVVDFGVLPNAEEVQGIEAEPIFKEWLYLVTAVESRKRVPVDIEFQDLSERLLVMGPRSMHMRRYVERMAGECGVALHVRYEQHTIGTITSVVRAGLASTISNWPSAIDSFPVGTVTLQKIVSPELQRVIAIAHPVGRPLRQPAKAAYDIVKRLLIERVKDGRWRGALL